MHCRYFAIIKPNGTRCGRFTGSTPKQAARKCACRLYQKLAQSGQNPNQEITFIMRETTRHSKRKMYFYKAKRVHLLNPQSVTITDQSTGQNKTITYKYLIKVHKIPNPDKQITKIPDTSAVEPELIIPQIPVLNKSISRLTIEI